MQYIVEVCASDRGMVDSMADMRTWLDHKRIEPLAFRQRRDAARMTFQVDFNHAPDAIEFARAFGGRVLEGPVAPLAASLQAPVAEFALPERVAFTPQ